VQVKPAGRPFSKTHAKALVADGRRAWIGTVNFTDTWVKRRDYALVTDKPETVRTLTALFDQDWLGTSTALRLPGARGVDPRSDLVVSPTEGRAAITAFLNGARRSLLLEQNELTDTSITDLLVKRSREGLDVQVVLNESETNRRRAQALQQRAPNMRVQLLEAPYVHAKLIVADEARVLLGSQNLTTDSLDTRREIGIVTQDPLAVARVLEVLRTDYMAAKDGGAAIESRPSREWGVFVLGVLSGVGVTSAGAAGWWYARERLRASGRQVDHSLRGPSPDYARA